MKIDESTIPFLNADFDADRFIGRLRDINYLEPTAAVQLLGLGFSAGQEKDLYIFLDVTERIDANMVFPRDLMKLVFSGNDDLAGQTFDLSDMKADLSYYREIGFGASKNINQKLRIGAKARLLFGLATASFQNYAMNLTVNDDLTNTLDANMALDFSGPMSSWIRRIILKTLNLQTSNSKFGRNHQFSHKYKKCRFWTGPWGGIYSQ